MKVIWRYSVPKIHEFGIDMPAGAKILTLQMQDGKPCIFAECDSKQPMKMRRFKMVYTDDYFEGEGLTYVGSFLEDYYMSHVYEVHDNPVEVPQYAMELPVREII